MFYRVGCLALCLSMAGCAGTQLAQNTLDVTSSVGEILKQQTLRNIGKQISDPAMIPDQMDFVLGNIETNYQITPTLTDPLTAALTTTNTIVKGATGALTSTTDTRTQVATGKTLSLSGQNAWKQSWQVLPESNTRSLIALSLMYRFVVGQIDDETFIKEFAIVKANLVNSNPMRCVICVPKGKAASKVKGHINPKLSDIREALYWRSADGRSKPPPSSAFSLGSYSGNELYSTNPAAVRDLVFFIQDVITGDDDPVEAKKGDDKTGAGKGGGKATKALGITKDGDVGVVVKPKLSR